MKTKRLLPFLIGLLILGSCTDDTFAPSKKTTKAPSDLNYANTGEAREGKTITSGQPSIQTYGSNVIFSIAEVKSETDQASDLIDQFSIIDSTGVVNIPFGNTLKGESSYLVDILVKGNGDSTLFTDGYMVNILKALIEGLGYPISKESFERGQDTTSREPDFIGNTEELAFFLEETPGSEHFTINSATGAILMSASASPEIGEYPLTVSANNAADSLMTFRDALTINIVSKPYRLTYEPALEEGVQEGAPRTTQAPKVDASNPANVSYRLATNTPEYYSVNTNTGAVTLKTGHPYLRGTSEKVDLIASNSYGEMLFSEAVGFSFVEPTTDPPSTLIYNDNGSHTIMEEQAFQSSVPSVEGGYPLQFSIISGNSSNEFSINTQSGIISLSKGHPLDSGLYLLEVQAKNAYDSTTVEYSLNIIPLVKEVIFDGDFTASGAIKNGAIGNMRMVDLDNNGDLNALKKAWYGKSSIWSKIDNKKRAGIQFIAQKEVNNDWIYAEQVDLSNVSSAELFIEWYQLYGKGSDAVSQYNIKVSTDFNGDVQTATWDQIEFLNDIFKNGGDNLLGSGYDVTPDYVGQNTIDLSAYDGMVVTVAIQALHDHTLADGFVEADLKRASYFTEFVIKGLNN